MKVFAVQGIASPVIVASFPFSQMNQTTTTRGGQKVDVRQTFAAPHVLLPAAPASPKVPPPVAPKPTKEQIAAAMASFSKQTEPPCVDQITCTRQSFTQTPSNTRTSTPALLADSDFESVMAEFEESCDRLNTRK